MRNRIVIAMLLCAAAVTEAAAGGRLFTRRESWQDGTLRGWQDRDDFGMSVEWTAESYDRGALAGKFAPQPGPVLPEYDAFVVDATASQGKFTGNYYAGGLTPVALSFDLMAGGVLPSAAILRLAGSHGGTNRVFWTSVTAQLVQAQEWAGISVPLDFAAGAWRGGTASEFTNLLHAVSRAEIQLLRRGDDEQMFRVDNFALVWRVPAAIADADSDGDGLPDFWEEAYYGGPTNASASADDDGDGAHNLEELAAGTDPMDDKSALGIYGLYYRGGWTLLLRSEPGVQYCPVATTSLPGAGPWTEIGDWKPGVGGFMPLSCTNNPGRLFLRVKASLQSME